MTVLVLGLVLFLGVHSVRVFAEDWRRAQIDRRGGAVWKIGYTALSLVGFGLLVWGFGLARQQPVPLWPAPPAGMRHVAALLMLAAFVLLAAAYVPRNRIRAAVHHPMTLSVLVWAVAHLIANNTLAELLLFGSFLLWAGLVYGAARRRDRAAGTVYGPGTASGTGITVVSGLLAWAVFAFWLHGWLFGVRPFGG